MATPPGISRLGVWIHALVCGYDLETSQRHTERASAAFWPQL